MSGQLALNVKLKDASSFGNFLPGPNREAFEQLRTGVVAAATEAAASALLYLWGVDGCGKTHLLQAACRLAQELGTAPVYVPLSEAVALTPDLLEGAEDAHVVCLDGIERIAGRSAWEAAVFALTERRRGARGLQVIAASVPPDRMGLKLPDLASRLAAGTTYALQPLSDAEKREAVLLHARHRGFELPDEVARYILERYPRDLHSLFGLLDRIDQAALAQQRRVTIPFLRRLEALDQESVNQG